MSPLVQVKGMREGLLMILGEGEWKELQQALLALIDEQRDFLRGGKVYLDVGNQILHAAELGGVRDQISERGISLWGVLSNSPTTVTTAQTLGLATRLSRQTEKNTHRAISAPETRFQDGEPAIFIRRTLRSGFSLKNPGHILVIGDVNPGAEIVAGGSVVVWGMLRGAVHAGAEGDRNAMVCALDMSPTQLRIVDQVLMAPAKKGKPHPEMARLQDDQIIVEYWNIGKGKTGGIWPRK